MGSRPAYEKYVSPLINLANRFAQATKPRLGALAAREIGLETMRAECPHFDCWVSRLERRTA